MNRLHQSIFLSAGMRIPQLPDKVYPRTITEHKKTPRLAPVE